MRVWPFLVLPLLGAAALLAAPLPVPPSSSGPPTGEPSRAEADQFARLLSAATRQIAEQYVRPVERHELTFTALAALYERAGRKAPATLEADCRAAKTEEDWYRLILRARQDVGDAERLQGVQPLVVCAQAVARSLDPYTGVVCGEEQRRTTGLEQDYPGVGLDVGDNPAAPVVVRQVRPGGPAQRAGLRPGDEITHVNGRPVGKYTSEELARLLNHTLSSGPPSVVSEDELFGQQRSVTLVYQRKGAKKPLTVTLERTCFRAETVLGVTRRDDNSWSYWIDAKRGLAHLRLTAFAKGTDAELREVVATLSRENLRGLILDLRWCPGGFLAEAVECASLFLGEGTVSTVRMRALPDQVHQNKQASPYRDIPLVVLVNGDTMGGAELVAAALQDHGRAKVVGQRTFGKASVQTPLHLGPPDLGMKLTSGTFERPSGKNLHRFPDSKPADDWGVRPDAGLEFRVSADLNRGLREWWQQQTLRPGPSMERLPLDDPNADPPRQAALREVVRMTSAKSE